jgi:hypothetical protein
LVLIVSGLFWLMRKTQGGAADTPAPSPEPDSSVDPSDALDPIDREPPKRIRIVPDEHRARYVGRTESGQQFFITTPFEPNGGDRGGRSFIAVYLFGADGVLVDARIDDLGPSATIDPVVEQRAHDQCLAELGKTSIEPIEIAPFELERFGIRFGLIVTVPEQEDEPCWVEAKPGNYMAFYPPWDGRYDT